LNISCPKEPNIAQNNTKKIILFIFLSQHEILIINFPVIPEILSML
jgi:hypothetical protein